jgi:hypothetical protein
MKYRFSVLLAAIALAGFLFCLLSALGLTDALCLTLGCEVYKGYTVAGISLYWIGAAVFLLLGVISLWPGNYRLLTILTGMILVGNFAFLILQFLLWPCTSCLIVAAFIGSFAWCLAGQVKSGLRILCTVWLLLFSANLLLLAKDSIQPWPVLGKNNAEILVFFSPTCPACRQVVENFLQHPELATSVAFYPLAKDEEDHRRINLLVRNLKQGMPVVQAFDFYWQTLPATENPGRNWYLAFNLWRNQLHLAKKGATQVPLVISQIPLEKGPDISVAPPNGCSIFSRDSETCLDEPPPDPFETIFK